MALSNWDILAIDHEGNPSNGVFRSSTGVEVEFYKNWLYVRDEAGWTDNGFMRPTVMQISEGSIRYKDVEIVAFRGPQDGVYAVVWHTHYPKRAEGEPYKPAVITGMAGCGVYGYSGDVWTGVAPESTQFLAHELNVKYPHSSRIPKHDRGEFVRAVPDLFRALPFESGQRFNQGDAFFADKLGIDVPATSPGEAMSPILMRVLGVES